MKSMLALLLLAVPVLAQDQAAAARAAAGCGPSEVQFDVKTDKKQHPAAQPDASKAMVYVFEDSYAGSITTKVGLDGTWVGANRGKSYFFFPVAPGDHRLCTTWQSSLERISALGAAAVLTAEAGKVYYFRTKVEQVGEHHPMAVKLDPVDSAEGQLLVASFSLSSFQAKK